MAKTLFQFTEGNAPALTDYCMTGQDPSGSPAMRRLTWQSILNLFNATNGITPILPPGRLTLESGVPVSTTDQADKTTLYYTLMTGNKIQLYSGTAWATYTIASELSLDISAFTASKPYDIWAYNNAGTVALDSTVWTDATTRATALAYQDGRLVKSGATTRLYLGTIYIDSGKKCQDTLKNRFVWNYYNRLTRKIKVIDTTDTWAYTTSTFRQANNSAANQVNLIIGVSEDPVIAQVNARFTNTNTGVTGVAGIGVDAVDTQSADIIITNAIATANVYRHTSSLYSGYLLGFHFLAWLEWSTASGTMTWAGDAGGTLLMSGILGEIKA
jgi:hypothetical protein